MLHDVVQRKKFYTLVLQKCLTRSDIISFIVGTPITIYDIVEHKYKELANNKLETSKANFFKFKDSNGNTYMTRNVSRLIHIRKKSETLHYRAAQLEGKLFLGDETKAFLEFVEQDYEKSISNRARTSFKKNKVRDLAILSLFLSSGLRCAELVGINLNDLNLETGKVRVMRKEGKKDVVPIAHFSHKYITDYFEARSSLNTDVEALFITDYNQTIRKISNASINKLVAKYSEAYKVRVTPHTLRHTFATRLYNVSHSQVLVSNQLGHSSTKPTELYTHIVSAEAKDALRKL